MGPKKKFKFDRGATANPSNTISNGTDSNNTDNIPDSGPPPNLVQSDSSESKYLVA